jgi:hypothetical protein
MQDQGIVDEFLPQVLFDALQSSFAVFGALLSTSFSAGYHAAKEEDSVFSGSLLPCLPHLRVT